MKHIADLALACALIALTLPLMGMVALAIKLDSPGPVFTHHRRLGLGDRQISALRFRTTVHDPQRAPRQLTQLTRVGSFLRYARIDGLPELVNVVRGEMSLIGTDRERPTFLR